MGNDVSLLDKWYRTDFNSVPPVSILQPIDTYLVHFLNKRVPKLQARDSGIWWGTLAKMQLVRVHTFCWQESRPFACKSLDCLMVRVQTFYWQESRPFAGKSPDLLLARVQTFYWCIF